MQNWLRRSSVEMNSFDAGSTFPFAVVATAEQLLLAKGDVLTAVLVISGVGSAPIDKWGYKIFQATNYNYDGSSIPVEKFQVTPLPGQYLESR